MNFRWWNSFNLLAVLLIAAGVLGLMSGGRMVFEPGRVQTGKEWLIYLVAGGLMFVNGLLPGSTSPAPPQKAKAHPAQKPQP